MLFVTLVTPSAARATASIFCLSSAVETGPASVTTPLVTLTSTEVIVAAPTSVAGSARYYALLYAILVDAAIAHFDSKYTYNFWRPITAIRNGDLDGNPATDPDAGWTSLVESPPHPEYPCAHCNTGTAFATVLAGLVGPGRRVAIRGADNARREFASASEVAADIVNARVYSGIHFRNSAEAGAAMGKQLGEYVLATQLRPLP